MARYAGTGTRTDGGTALGLLFLEQGGTVRRLRTYDVLLGNSGTPADVAYLYELSDGAAGVAAGTTFTPEPLDPDDVAALAAPLKTMTTNPTTISTEPLLQVPLNQRATFRWVAAPGGELMTAATAGVGLLVQHTTASGSTATFVTLHWEE